MPEHKKEFVESLEKAVHYANTLGCKKLMEYVITDFKGRLFVINWVSGVFKLWVRGF